MLLWACSECSQMITSKIVNQNLNSAIQVLQSVTLQYSTSVHYNSSLSSTSFKLKIWKWYWYFKKEVDIQVSSDILSIFRSLNKCCRYKKTCLYFNLAA